MPASWLQEVHLELRLVLEKVVARGAIPPRLDGRATGLVSRCFGRDCAPGPQCASRRRAPASSMPSAVSSGGAGRSLDVGPREQNRVTFEALEALRQDVGRDPRDLLQQLVEPPRTREEGLYDEQSPPVPDASQCVGKWGGCIL